MKLKKNYSFTNKRQIWRLIPTDTGKLIIEERNTDTKQVYFNCLQIDSGKKIFKNLQLDEKFWIGIEAVYKDVIFFHKFAKPDMPQHLGIIAFDINNQKILWRLPDQSFQLAAKDTVYSYQQLFERKKYFALNFETGEEYDEVTVTDELINKLNDEMYNANEQTGYIFPSAYSALSENNAVTNEYLENYKKENVITGKIDYLLLYSHLLFSFHTVNSNGTLKNHFKAVDLSTGKFILEEVLNKESKLFIPESFFIKDDLLFLLIEKTRLNVYSINN